jgi:intracellular sulfur oxidation DsrE/DsrF family protein
VEGNKSAPWISAKVTVTGSSGKQIAINKVQMKKLLFLVILLAMTNIVTAQTTKDQVTTTSVIKQHKIVFQVTSDDTLVHKSLMKQLKNILTVAPDTKIEVVCHGPGLFMLVKERSMYQEQIKGMRGKGVQFAACEFAMAERKITKEQLVAEAVPVPSGILEIATRQEEGWSYIRSGF